jgi:hypothetical protein
MRREATIQSFNPSINLHEILSVNPINSLPAKIVSNTSSEIQDGSIPLVKIESRQQLPK